MSGAVLYSYIGTKPCGHTVAAIHDKPEYREDAAKAIAEWVRDGLKVERVTSDELRTRFSDCDCLTVKPGWNHEGQGRLSL